MPIFNVSKNNESIDNEIDNEIDDKINDSTEESEDSIKDAVDSAVTEVKKAEKARKPRSKSEPLTVDIINEIVESYNKGSNTYEIYCNIKDKGNFSTTRVFSILESNKELLTRELELTKGSKGRKKVIK